MGNEATLNQLVNEQEKAVFKSMRTDMETGKAVLNVEQLGYFLREATLDNTILRDADFKLMKSFKKFQMSVRIWVIPHLLPHYHKWLVLKQFLTFFLAKDIRWCQKKLTITYMVSMVALQHQLMKKSVVRLLVMTKSSIIVQRMILNQNLKL